jgi:hypothetical protein
MLHKGVFLFFILFFHIYYQVGRWQFGLLINIKYYINEKIIGARETRTSVWGVPIAFWWCVWLLLMTENTLPLESSWHLLVGVARGDCCETDYHQRGFFFLFSLLSPKKSRRSSKFHGYPLSYWYMLMIENFFFIVFFS